MRVAFRSQYSNFLYNLQITQSRLMELNMQASSQKRINKPSDDPVGTARVLNYRSSLAAINQYQKNIDTSMGWLNLADETLMQTSTILTRLKGLAEQGATGTLTASDREATAFEARNLLGQLINLSNTRYEGNSIFGGHKFDASAYEEGLMVYDQDGQSVSKDGQPIALSITGASSRSILVQFIGTGTATVGTDVIAYQYSDDGGKSWKEGTIAAGERRLDLGGVEVMLRADYEVELSPEENNKTSEGSWLTVAPTAIYKGDHETQSAVTFDTESPGFTVVPLGGFTQDVEVSIPANVTFGNGTSFDATLTFGGVSYDVTVSNTSSSPIIETIYGGIQILGGTDPVSAETTFTVHAKQTAVYNLGSDLDVNARAQGVFTKDVVVRVDTDTTIGGGTFEYSYSIDGGVTWSEGHKASNAQDQAELLVPGGKLVLSARGTSAELISGNQFVIHPHTAAHNIEITTNEYIQVNNTGSNIFGGYYEHGQMPIFSSSSEGKNIFVTVGKLVAALENNDQQACGQALENLEEAHEHLTVQLASVGGRENRLTVANAVLTGLKLNETERMSNVEDIDLATLMTDLTNQQWAYEAVLKSSSMIMRMSLLNYL